MSDDNSSRTRNWCALVYPDSAPENWREILDDYHIAWAESPLHQFDVNPDGELKKPHWHIVLSFEGNKSLDQVCKMLSKVGSPLPKECASLRGATRYLCHLDNPEKYLYPWSEVVSHGGFDLAKANQPTASMRYQFIGDMIDYCVSHNITEFCDLLNYARLNRFDDWFPALCDSSAYVMTCYLKSARFKLSNSVDTVIE